MISRTGIAPTCRLLSAAPIAALTALALIALALPTLARAETKTLTLDSKEMKSMRIDVAGGDLVIEGVANGSQIEVIATFDEDERDIELSLTREGDRAALLSGTEEWHFWVRRTMKIDLRVKVPHGLELDIDDGSGDIRISNTVGEAEIDDGSGSIEIKNHRGDLEVEDGSGSIDISGVVGDVYVEDGSGRMSITNVDGKVTIDDGSGPVNVENVTKGLTILDDGSGDFSTENIAGGIRDRS